HRPELSDFASAAPAARTRATSAPPPDSPPRPPHAPHYADAFHGHSSSQDRRLHSDTPQPLATTGIAPLQKVHSPWVHSGRFLSRGHTGARPQRHTWPSRRPSHSHCRPAPRASDGRSSAPYGPASAARSQHPSPGRTRRSSGATAHPPLGWFG